MNTCVGKTSARRASGHVGFMLVRVEMTLVIASSLGEDTANFASIASITGTDAAGAWVSVLSWWRGSMGRGRWSPGRDGHVR